VLSKLSRVGRKAAIHVFYDEEAEISPPTDDEARSFLWSDTAKVSGTDAKSRSAPPTPFLFVNLDIAACGGQVLPESVCRPWSFYSVVIVVVLLFPVSLFAPPSVVSTRNVFPSSSPSGSRQLEYTKTTLANPSGSRESGFSR
jgi:hypothetical protein